MVCAQCGAAMVEDARFCARCGAPVVMRASVPGPAAVVEDARFGVGPGYGGGYPAAGVDRVGIVDAARIGRNVQTLGVLWCCFAGWRLLSGLLGLVFFRTFALGHGRFGGWMVSPGPEMPWLAGLMPLIAVATVMAVLLSLVTGWALLTRQSWGRGLAIAAAILSMLKFPLGTALGVYTLVVLLRRGAREEWERITGFRNMVSR